MKNLTKKLCFIALLFASLSAFCQVPKLSSLPALTPTPTIFLDFDGHSVQHAAWRSGNAFYCDPAILTTAQMTDIFNRVSEDYRPFEVNVTTDSAKFLAAPVTQRIRVIVTPTSAWYPGVGGVAYTGSFTWGTDAPCFVFPDKLSNNPKYIGECCSHESGHSVGLSHQAKFDASCVLTEPYNTGIGVNAEQTSWAPIMGNSYYKNMTGWNVGPTPFDCATAQDNISIIVSTNGFGYRADDYTETLDNNTTAINVNNINAAGIITTTTDKDAFKITLAQNSTIHFEVNPFSLGANNAGANLDVMLSLYNSSNTLIRTYDPLTTMNVIVDTTLATGTYYFVVDGTGNNNVSQYGSLGSYTITGSRGVLAIHNISLQGKNINSKHQLNWSIIADEPIVKQVLEASSNGIDFSPIMTDVTGAKSFTNTPNKSGTIFYRLKVTSSIGESNYSNIVGLKSNGNEKLFEVSTLVQQDIKVTAIENYSYNLYDANARLIASGKERKGVNNINVANLPTGMYVLQMMNDNYKQTERIIKQ
jgi:Secretion system C-terminal sorting domain